MFFPTFFVSELHDEHCAATHCESTYCALSLSRVEKEYNVTSRRRRDLTPANARAHPILASFEEYSHGGCTVTGYRLLHLSLSRITLYGVRTGKSVTIPSVNRALTLSSCSSRSSKIYGLTLKTKSR